jgi:hypothetical protein
MSSAEILAAELVRRASSSSSASSWRPQSLAYSPPQRTPAAAPSRSILKKRAAEGATMTSPLLPALSTPLVNGGASSAASAASSVIGAPSPAEEGDTPTQAGAGGKSVRFSVRDAARRARARVGDPNHLVSPYPSPLTHPTPPLFFPRAAGPRRPRPPSRCRGGLPRLCTSRHAPARSP